MGSKWMINVKRSTVGHFEASLCEKEILIMNEMGPAVSAPVPPTAVWPLPVATPRLTFEQQKELVLLHLEHDKCKLQAMVETQWTEQEKELALEKVKLEAEAELIQ